jgi:ORF6N domain.
MTKKHSGTALVPIEHIAQSIFILCGQKVLLDAELAVLYGVTTKRFNEQIRRNRQRFPTEHGAITRVESLQAPHDWIHHRAR